MAMKILQLTKYYPPHFGGIESVTYDLTEGLNSRGINCDVLCSEDGWKTSIETDKGYKVIRASRFFEVASTAVSLMFPLSLKRVQNQYDIIHVHFPNPMAALALYLSRPTAHIVLHWHSDVIRQKDVYKYFRPLEAWVLSKATRIVTTSPPYASGSDALKGYEHKITVVPIGIAPDKTPFNPLQVESLKRQYPGKHIVFSLGRMVYYKGFEYLIKSARYLSEDTLILIGGGGELMESLQALIASEGVTNKVKLVGRIKAEELSSFFQASDLFCLPSIERSEAFGVVLLEAMRAGKPIVATNIEGSGVNWVNQDGLTGINVPVRDERSLAEAIELVLTDQALRARLANGAKQRYHQQFTDDLMVDSFLKVYDELMKGT
jgi:glycosyltransferase involved in cell wall biosynthesis